MRASQLFHVKPTASTPTAVQVMSGLSVSNHDHPLGHMDFDHKARKTSSSQGARFAESPVRCAHCLACTLVVSALRTTRPRGAHARGAECRLVPGQPKSTPPLARSLQNPGARPVSLPEELSLQLALCSDAGGLLPGALVASSVVPVFVIMWYSLLPSSFCPLLPVLL